MHSSVLLADREIDLNDRCIEENPVITDADASRLMFKRGVGGEDVYPCRKVLDLYLRRNATMETEVLQTAPRTYRLLESVKIWKG